MTIPAESQVASAATRRTPFSFLTERQRKWMPYIFVAPFFITFAIFKFYPVLYSVVMGFQENAMFTNEWVWVGLDNYIEVLTRDVRFVTALKNFVIYSFFSIVTQIPAAFFLALLLASSHLRGRSIFRAAYFLPSILPGVTIGVLGVWMFSESRGLANELVLGLGGVERTPFLSLPRYTMPILITLAFWQWTGYHAVFFLAGITGMGQEVIEAAIIDGASYLDRARYIILPLLRPIMAFVTITISIGSLMMYDVPFIIFSAMGSGSLGGPGDQGWFFVPLITYNAFDQFRMGYATAIGWLVFLIAIIVTVIQLRLYNFGEID